MSDFKFALVAEKAINKIAEIVELYDQECKFDIDINDSVLTLKTSDATYVINKQSAAAEIWLSSPISGPHHFALVNDRWRSKSGIDLFEVLSTELKINIQ